MAMHPKVVTLKPWKGLNNTNAPHTTPPEYLKNALNVDIYGEGVSKRKGYTKVASGNISSLWASTSGLGCYGVVGSDLVEIYSDYSFSASKLVIDSVDAISFEEVDNKIYFCNNSNTGIIESGVLKSWGITKTQPILNLTITDGNLLAGEYQVSYTVVNLDGIESGCSEAQVITLPTDHSGISFPIGSITGEYIRVYCSTQNGKVLYYSGICMPSSTYVISSVSSFSNPLRTFNLDKAPTGHIVKYFNGRLYIAQDNILWYSEKYQYQHFDLSKNYIEFPDRIKGVMPVESGIWIGSDKLYFLSGQEPDKFDRLIRDSAKMVEGTSTKVNGLHALQPLQPAIYYWMVTTNLGVYSLMEQGTAVNQSISQVEFEGADSGSSLLLRANGMTQYLSMLKLNDAPNNTTLGELIETNVIRNNIFNSKQPLNNTAVGDLVESTITRDGHIIT